MLDTDLFIKRKRDEGKEEGKERIRKKCKEKERSKEPWQNEKYANNAEDSLMDKPARTAEVLYLQLHGMDDYVLFSPISLQSARKSS